MTSPVAGFSTGISATEPEAPLCVCGACCSTLAIDISHFRFAKNEG
jgi:hypothetical protein